MGPTTTAAKSLLGTELNGPRFAIVTKALGATTDESGRRRFRATASSTITDRQGDQISLKALEQMRDRFREGITIFTDHENKVANAFGTTDTAEIIQRGHDPKTGLPIYDLDIAGGVNEPNPNAVQLHDSIAGGFVRLGCSIDAFVTDHKPKKAGRYDIDGLDVFAASIVGVPMNQRSWTQKAVRAIKGYLGEPEEEDVPEDVIAVEPASEAVTEAVEPVVEEVEVEKAIDTDNSDALDRQDIVHKAATCSACGHNEPCGCTDCACEAPGHADTDHDGDSAADTDLDGKSIDALADEAITKGTTEGGQEADPAATPETAPSEAIDGTDTAAVRKAVAFEADDVVVLVKHVESLVKTIEARDETIVTLTKDLTDLKAERDQLAAENEVAKQVIEKVMAMPLRPKTVGYVADLSKKLPDFLAPEVKSYLTKTAGEAK